MAAVETLAAIFRLVTREEPSARVREALGDFPGYALGTLAARSLSVAAQLYVARHLDPADFGRFSLALAVALVLSVPVHDAWGGAFVKFSAAHPAASGPPWHLLRAALLLALGSGAVLLALACAATPLATSLLDVPPAVYLTGLVTAAAATLWFFAKATCQGLLVWKRLVFIEVSFGVAVVAAPIAVRVASGNLDWRVVAVFAAAYLLSALAALPYWLAAPAAAAQSERRRLWDFGKYLAGAAVVLPVLLFSDRFLVNAWAGLEALGLYQAYALPSLGVAVFVAALVNRYLYPLFNRGDPAAFRRLFTRALPWATAVFLPAIAGLTFLVLLYLGYPIDAGLIALSAVAALAFCVMTFLTHLVASHETDGPRIVLQTHVLASLIFFPLTMSLLSVRPIAAPFLGYTVAFTVASVFALRRCAALERASRR
jgi:O-antigen/teichoic acid export membrane protein